MASVPELKGGQMITIAYIIAILIVLFIIYKILGAVGLIKTRAKKVEEKTETEAASTLRGMKYFNPMLLKTEKPVGYVPLASVGKECAVALRDAVKGAGTDEEKIYTTFGRLKNKYNISEVALNYLVEYNRDLLTDLMNDMSSEENVTLLNIINKLPTK